MKLLSVEQTYDILKIVNMLSSNALINDIVIFATLYAISERVYMLSESVS